MEIFSGLWIYRVPPKKIAHNDFIYLGMRSDNEYLLVKENGELRIYRYDYWSEDTINNFHSGEDWRGELRECFDGLYDCFALETIKYMPLIVDGMKTYDIAKEIVERCWTVLDDDLATNLVVENNRENRCPSMALLSLIDGIQNKTYCYYK